MTEPLTKSPKILLSRLLELLDPVGIYKSSEIRHCLSLGEFSYIDSKITTDWDA